jgi:hypothetical protein
MLVRSQRSVRTASPLAVWETLILFPLSGIFGGCVMLGSDDFGVEEASSGNEANADSSHSISLADLWSDLGSKGAF